MRKWLPLLKTVWEVSVFGPNLDSQGNILNYDP